MNKMKMERDEVVCGFFYLLLHDEAEGRWSRMSPAEKRKTRMAAYIDTALMFNIGVSSVRRIVKNAGKPCAAEMAGMLRAARSAIDVYRGILARVMTVNAPDVCVPGT